MAVAARKWSDKSSSRCSTNGRVNTIGSITHSLGFAVKSMLEICLWLTLVVFCMHAIRSDHLWAKEFLQCLQKCFWQPSDIVDMLRASNIRHNISLMRWPSQSHQHQCNVGGKLAWEDKTKVLERPRHSSSETESSKAMSTENVTLSLDDWDNWFSDDKYKF